MADNLGIVHINPLYRWTAERVIGRFKTQSVMDASNRYLRTLDEPIVIARDIVLETANDANTKKLAFNLTIAPDERLLLPSHEFNSFRIRILKNYRRFGLWNQVYSVS